MSDTQDWMPAGVLPVLGTFEGKPILGTAIAITGAGDGLSKALAIDPVELHHGDKVFVVSECIVDKVGFDPIKDTNGVMRVHRLRAGTSTIIDAAVVSDAITAQAAKIETAAKLARGEHKMPLPENLQEEHDAGGHADALVAGCPECDSEAEVAAAEKAAREGTPTQAVRPIGSGRKRAPKAAAQVPADGKLSPPVSGDGSGEALPPIGEVPGS